MRAFRSWLAVPFAALLAGSIAWLSVPGAMNSFTGLMIYLALTVLPVVPVMLFLSWKRPVAGLLTVAPDGVYLGGRCVARLSRVTQAVAYPVKQGAGARISLRLNPVPLDLELDSDADAQALLEALSKDSRQATAAFQAVRGGMVKQMHAARVTLVLAFGCLAAFTGVRVANPHIIHHLFAAHAVAAWVTVALAYFALLGQLAYFGARDYVQLVVGAEGILAAGRGKKRAFYSFDTIREVRREKGDVVLELTSGEIARFGVGGQSRFEGAAGELAINAVLTRIAEARGAYATLGASSDLASVLARGDRDVPTWRASLRSLLGDATTYRTPAVPPETLWRVLEDPTQPATARAGAAVALRGTLDEETRVRLRVATATCASAELRGAFEATLSEEEDEAVVERALGAIGMELR